MTDAAPAPDVARDPAAVDAEQWGADPDWAEAVRLTSEIAAIDEQLEALRHARRDCYRRLIGRGATLAALGRLAGVSPMAVKFELDPSSRAERRNLRRTKTVPPPGG